MGKAICLHSKQNHKTYIKWNLYNNRNSENSENSYTTAYRYLMKWIFVFIIDQIYTIGFQLIWNMAIGKVLRASHRSSMFVFLIEWKCVCLLFTFEIFSLNCSRAISQNTRDNQQQEFYHTTLLSFNKQRNVLIYIYSVSVLNLDTFC